MVGGLLLGILNTVLTESVMNATELSRSVASSGLTSAVRVPGWSGWLCALATELAKVFTPATPYFVGAASILLAAIIVLTGRKQLARVDAGEPAHQPIAEAQVLTAADAA